MKFSRFNIVARTENGNCLLSNSVTGAVCLISNEKYKTVKSSLNCNEDNEELQLLIRDLRKGGFIIDDEIDEASRVKYLANYDAYKGDHLNLIILPTEQCNFRCAYCYESFQKGEMSEEIRKRIKQLVEKKAPLLKRLSVGWFGGEPLMAYDTIMDLSHAFLETKKTFGLQYDSHITTNGYLLDRKMMLQLLSVDIRRIQVTIDGFREEHDRRRKLTHGGETFDVLATNIKTAKELDEKFQFTVRVNFDNDNVNGVPQLLDLLKEIFKEDRRFGVFFRPIGNFGGINGEINKLNLASREDNIPIQLTLEEQALARGLKVNEGFKAPSLQSYLCYAAQPNSFVVGSDGSLYKCTVYFNNDVNKIGYVDKEGNLKTNLGKMAQWVGYKGDEDPVCKRCSLLPSCYAAACPAARLMSKTRPCPMKVSEVKEGLRFLYNSYHDNGKEVKYDVSE